MAIPDETVLLVEDRDDDVKLLLRAFKKTRLPARVEVARNGGQAFAYLTGTAPYDDRERYPLPVLITLDLKMPRVDGYELLEKLKRDAALKNIPIVILTSVGEAASVSRTYALGADFYFVKPATAGGFAAVAREIEKYWLEIKNGGVHRTFFPKNNQGEN